MRTAEQELTEHPDEVCTVYYRDGSVGCVDPCHEPEIDAALARFAGEGESRFSDSELRDTVLRLRTLAGARITVLASALFGCSVTTRESRQLKAIQDRSIEADAVLPAPDQVEAPAPDHTPTEV